MHIWCSSILSSFCEIFSNSGCVFDNFIRVSLIWYISKTSDWQPKSLQFIYNFIHLKKLCEIWSKNYLITIKKVCSKVPQVCLIPHFVTIGVVCLLRSQNQKLPGSFYLPYGAYPSYHNIALHWLIIHQCKHYKLTSLIFKTWPSSSFSVSVQQDSVGRSALWLAL